MTDHPINLRPWQVVAAVESRLSVLVVPMKPQPTQRDDGLWDWANRHGGLLMADDAEIADYLVDMSPLIVGERYWARETWGCPPADHPLCSGQHGYRKPMPGDRLVYQANPADAWQWRGGPGCSDFCWRSAAVMPRWASRITIVPTEVRVCRLHEFAAQLEDSVAEGVGMPLCRECHGVGWINSGPDGGWQCTAHGCGDAYEDQFRELWDRDHGPGAYERNPWCAVARAAVHLRNIDSMEGDQ